MIPLIYLAVTFLYTSLQSRYIFGGDSAEYSTVARTWGIAHPPGYPLYSLLINILNRAIPFGTTPWKIALLSSIPTVITAYFIYKILRIIKLHKYSALAASLLYLFLFPVWQYALIPEVFGLHTMLVALITYLLLKFTIKTNNKLLLCASFLCGLCISNHHIFVLFIPGWLSLLKGRFNKILSNKTLVIQMLALGLLGASFYLYAVIASLDNTVLDWENAKTVSGLFHLIIRSSYGSFKAYSGSGANIANQLSDIFSSIIFILLDFKPLGIAFIIFGLFVCRKYSKQFSNFLYISFVIHLVFLFYTNFILTSSFSSGMFERFLIPLYFILIFFLGIGINFVYQKYILLVANMVKNPSLKRVVKVSYLLFISVFVFFIASQNFKTISFIAQTKTFDQFGKDILETVPYGSIFTALGDNAAFTAYYHLYGEGKRKDLISFQLGQMDKINYIEMIKKRSSSLIISSPIKSDEEYMKFISNNLRRGYYADREMGFGTWRPYGLLWKYYPDNLSASSDSANILADNKRLWEQLYKIPSLSKEEKNIFHLDSVSKYYLTAYQNYAKLLVSMEKYAEAEDILKNIAMRYKKNDPQSEAEYMNILVFEKKCSEASRVAIKIGLDNTINIYPGFAKSALSYLQTCEPQNTKIPKYKKLLLELENKSKIDLNSF